MQHNQIKFILSAEEQLKMRKFIIGNQHTSRIKVKQFVETCIYIYIYIYIQDI